MVSKGNTTIPLKDLRRFSSGSLHSRTFLERRPTAYMLLIRVLKYVAVFLW